MVSAHSSNAFANEEDPPSEADTMEANAAFNIRRAANPPIKPEASVPNSVIGPHPPVPGNEDCRALTRLGIPKKANSPKTRMDSNVDTEDQTQ